MKITKKLNLLQIPKYAAVKVEKGDKVKLLGRAGMIYIVEDVELEENTIYVSELESGKKLEASWIPVDRVIEIIARRRLVGDDEFVRDAKKLILIGIA